MIVALIALDFIHPLGDGEQGKAVTEYVIHNGIQ
jgi:hypothetical protein